MANLDHYSPNHNHQNHVSPATVGNHCTSTATPEHVVLMDNEFISDFFGNGNGDSSNDTQIETNNGGCSISHMKSIESEEEEEQGYNRLMPLEHIDVWPHRLSKGGYQACDCVFESFE